MAKNADNAKNKTSNVNRTMNADNDFESWITKPATKQAIGPATEVITRRITRHPTNAITRSILLKNCIY